MAYVQRDPAFLDGRAEKPLGELFSDLAREVAALVQGEIALARVELTEKASRVGKDVGFLAAGALVAYAGFLVLLGGIVLTLALLIPLWISALAVGVVVLATGGVLVQRALGDLRRAELAPRRTMETLRDDVEWAKEQAR